MKFVLYTAAIVWFLAGIVSNTELTSIREGFAFMVSWFQSGGNMIADAGWRQAVDAWASTKN